MTTRFLQGESWSSSQPGAINTEHNDKNKRSQHTLPCLAMSSMRKLVRTLSTLGTRMEVNSGSVSVG